MAAHCKVFRPDGVRGARNAVVFRMARRRWGVVLPPASLGRNTESVPYTMWAVATYGPYWRMHVGVIAGKNGARVCA